jgi:hypothetical protein
LTANRANDRLFSIIPRLWLQWVAEDHQRRPRTSMTTLRPSTREEYLRQSKKNALALLAAGRIREATSSMMMDMRDASGALPHEIHAFGISAVAANDVTAVRAYIEGFI